jgi:lipid A 3-O-deacylase
VAALALAFSIGHSWAADAPRDSLSILLENDVFYDTDRDYTNGAELAYTTAPDDTPGGLVDFAHALPLMPDTGDVRASFSLGQDIFTPASTQLADPPLTERPYAGWLYVGLGLLAKDERNLDQLEIQVGTIGPASLARDSQAFVHSVLGDRKPQGWHFQLRDEPTLQLTYERAFKVIPPQSVLGLLFDLEPHVGAAAGNVYDYVNAGAMVRFGFNLPDDFGPLRMEPTQPGTNSFEPTGGFSAYVFAGIDGRALARNIFLDGNSFESSRSVPKRDFVGDLQLGAAIATENWRLSFTHVFRSKEYRGQPRSDQFGAVNLTFLL